MAMADKDINKDKDDTGELNDPTTGKPKGDSAETETEKPRRGTGGQRGGEEAARAGKGKDKGQGRAG